MKDPATVVQGQDPFYSPVSYMHELLNAGDWFVLKWHCESLLLVSR